MRSASFDANDLTYDYIITSTYTILEPLPGIIVASLPMFSPVLKEMLGGEGAHESPKVRSSSTTRLRSNGKKQLRIFPRLDDSYPLADLETGRTNQITGFGSRANSFGFDLSTVPYEWRQTRSL